MANMAKYNNNASTVMTPFANWFNGINTAFDDMFGFPTDMSNMMAPASMQMDVEDEPTAYDVKITVPGVDRDHIDIEMNQNHLNVTVDKKDSEEDSKKNYLRRETSEFHATRSVYLKDADSKGLTATLKDGVLDINVPKKQETQATKIEIQ